MYNYWDYFIACNIVDDMEGPTMWFILTKCKQWTTESQNKTGGEQSTVGIYVIELHVL